MVHIENHGEFAGVLVIGNAAALVDFTEITGGKGQAHRCEQE